MMTVYLVPYVFALNEYTCIPFPWQKYIAVRVSVSIIVTWDGFPQIVLGKSEKC